MILAPPYRCDRLVMSIGQIHFSNPPTASKSIFVDFSLSYMRHIIKIIKLYTIFMLYPNYYYEHILCTMKLTVCYNLDIKY